MNREFVYARFSGPTASYRLPTAISGSQLALEVPPYSSLLGMLSYAADREISPNDGRIGCRYKYNGKNTDLETVHRWGRNKSGSYSYNETNIRNREIHYSIEMEIILTNLEFKEHLDTPARQLTFGRSQDLVTIEEVQIVTGEQVQNGQIFGSLLPVLDNINIPGNGLFYNLPEYFEYFDGKIRRPRNIRSFLAINQYPQNIEFPHLWKVDLAEIEFPTFYLHQWMEDHDD